MAKVPMLDMFRRVLPAADIRDKQFYSRLTEEETKGFGPWLVQRYLSSAESANPGIIEHYLIMTNDIVNVDFSAIKDPEMIWLLMSVVGVGKQVKHPYIAPGGGKKKKKNAFKSWLSEQHPHLDDQELDIWLESLDKKSAMDMLEQYHVRDKDVIASAKNL